MTTWSETAYQWIMDRLDEGRTVYARNYLQEIRISPKHRDSVRLNGRHVEVQFGRRWDSINGCKISAR